MARERPFISRRIMFNLEFPRPEHTLSKGEIKAAAEAATDQFSGIYVTDVKMSRGDIPQAKVVLNTSSAPVDVLKRFVNSLESEIQSMGTNLVSVLVIAGALGPADKVRGVMQ